MKITKILAIWTFILMAAQTPADAVVNAEERAKLVRARYAATMASVRAHVHKQIYAMEAAERTTKARDVSKLNAMKCDGLIIESWDKVPAWIDNRNQQRIDRSRKQLIQAMYALRQAYLNAGARHEALNMDIEILAHEADANRRAIWPPLCLREERHFYLHHKLSSRYVGTHFRGNGAPVFLSRSIPSGDRAHFRFKLVATAEPHYFQIVHEHSGKFLCTANRGGDRLHLWAPIPDGHADHYQFKIIHAGGGYHCLFHKFSGKYVSTSSQENGAELQVWDAMAHEIKDAYRVRFVSDSQGEIPR